MRLLELLGFLGLPFSSFDHFVWFLLSMVLLLGMSCVCVASISASAFGVRAVCMLAFIVFGAGHGHVSEKAHLVTEGGLRAAQGYTPDCIWFNKYVGLIYLGLALAVLVSLVATRLTKTRTVAPRA